MTEIFEEEISPEQQHQIAIHQAIERIRMYEGTWDIMDDALLICEEYLLLQKRVKELEVVF